MLSETVFARTRQGALALAGQGTPLSAGFRKFLGLFDGKRSGREVLAAMPQLDEEDFSLWTGELMRQGLIAAKDAVQVDEMAFQLTSEMPPGAFGAAPFDPAVINNIIADVSASLGPEVDLEVVKRLSTTGRMAAIESVRSHSAMGKAGFFVYPDAAQGLPENPRVCIAGHVPAQNKVLELMFVRAGIRPRLAATRDQMRAELSGVDKPHILVVDAQMPMLDAFRTLDAMRMDSGLKGVRVVVISSRGERADLAHAMMLGAAAYIVKPLRKEVLDAALPQILGRPVGKS